MDYREQTQKFFKTLQKEICSGLESFEKNKKFESDNWKRKEGGGGQARVLQDGQIFEKAGVNFSAVYGEAPEFLKSSFEHSLVTGQTEVKDFFATGVSLVIHPCNPWVPIVHMNVRYFEAGPFVWFGGGIDLTPHYIIEDDARFFHRSLKEVCDKHDHAFYSEFKKTADDYFFIKHRNETRGIGGIFFDRLTKSKEHSLEDRFRFVQDVGHSFLPVYSSIVSHNKDRKISDRNKLWQYIRRGRYAEFNLVYDRGTRFGFETNGRTESILMSLPPMACWKYKFELAKGSREARTLDLLKKGINWI